MKQLPDQFSCKHRYREDMLHIYQAALARVAGDTAVSHWLKDHPSACGSQAVVAIGKAASAMMAGALGVLRRSLVAGLVITREGYTQDRLQDNPAIEQVVSSHPVPDGRSLDAGRQLLAFIAAQPLDRPLLFLLSGGTSSLVEVLPEHGSLTDLQRLNHWLLASGLDIRAMNQVRSRLSCIKGGQLVRYLQGRDARVLFISDVPGDDPAIVGSGLLFPQQPDLALPPLPDELHDCFAQPDVPPSRAIPHHAVATNAHALEAAAQAARDLGYETVSDFPFLQGDAETRGREFGQYLRQAGAGVHLMGGETTVRLPPEPGRGGRNQHLALAAAAEIQGREDLLVLAAATDGSDGMSEDAGALVDGGTWQRAIDEDFKPRQSLATADSGRLLEATGDLLHTGPTGTNVMDLLIGMRIPR
ncbi:glycerate kinase type-2 family protein [Thiolapillus sp.]